LDYLQLANKVKADLIAPEKRYARLKRNNDLGVAHKDMAYMKSLLEAVHKVNNYILSDGKEGIDLESLMI